MPLSGERGSWPRWAHCTDGSRSRSVVTGGRGLTLEYVDGAHGQDLIDAGQATGVLRSDSGDGRAAR
jgi:hypothetical protein